MSETVALLNAGPLRTGVGNYAAGLQSHLPMESLKTFLVNFNVFGSSAFGAYPSAPNCADFTQGGPTRFPFLNLPLDYLSIRTGSLRRKLESLGKFSLYHALQGDLNHLAEISERFVVTWHDAGFFRSTLSPYSRFLSWNSTFISKSSHVIVDSEFTKTGLMKRLGRLPRKLTVIHLGIGDQFKRIEKAQARRRLELPPDAPIILSIGRDWYPKNVRTLLEAMRLLRGVKLLRVGKFLASSDLASKVNPSSLIVREDVQDEELNFYYSASDALAFPSIHEGFGLEPLEAMKCGVPVITTRKGALPEVVGDNALVMKDPLDPLELSGLIRLVLENKETAASLSERGMAWASNFTLQATAAKTLAAYREVL